MSKKKASPVRTFECSVCGKPIKAQCRCVGCSPVAAGTRAAAAVAANPEKSNRALAVEAGVDHKTIWRARQTRGENSPPDSGGENSPPESKVIGKDGKKYPTQQPRGKKNEQKETIIGLHDAGLPPDQVAKETGVCKRDVSNVIRDERVRREAVAEVDRDDLPPSGQERLDAAIRQHKIKLDREFEARVMKGIQERLDEIVLPAYHQDLANAQEVIKGRKGVMSAAEFKKILACLHPDRVSPELKQRYTEAYSFFSSRELVLVSEAEKPTNQTDFPRTYAECLARRQPARKAKGHSNVAAA